MKYRPVPISNVDEETPRPPQGEMTAKPIPAPKDRRRRVSAQEAAAPAITAAQLTPEVVGSIRSVETTPVACSMWSSSFSCPQNAWLEQMVPKSRSFSRSLTRSGSVRMSGVKLGFDAGLSSGSILDMFCVLQPSVYPWGAATGVHDGYWNRRRSCWLAIGPEWSWGA